MIKLKEGQGHQSGGKDDVEEESDETKMTASAML